MMMTTASIDSDSTVRFVGFFCDDGGFPRISMTRNDDTSNNKSIHGIDNLVVSPTSGALEPDELKVHLDAV